MSKKLALISKKLTEGQERAALALSMGATMSVTAEASGVTVGTLERWMHIPGFVSRIVAHVDARTPAALARMRANLTEFLPTILETHSRNAILGDTASARVVLAVWRALEDMIGNNNSVTTVTPAQIASARAGNYDIVEGEVVGITIEEEGDKVEVGGIVEGRQDKGNYDPRNRSTDEDQTESVFIAP